MNNSEKNSKTRKRGLLLVFLGALIAVITAVAVVWNKPPATVDDQKGIKITATELCSAFESNEQQANATYLNKVMTVTGKIAEVTKNQDGQTVVLLESSDPLSGVQCTMKQEGNFTVGNTTTIKGFCNGYTLVVLLAGCVEVK
jgi:hypothetical protein